MSERVSPIRAVPRHDEDTRESAFDRWVILRKNVAAVSRDLGVPENTVRYWMRADRWRQRHAAELFPTERHEAYELVGTLLAAAAIYAAEEIHAHHDPENPFRFENKVHLDAAHGAVDRIGYGPVRVLTAPTFSEQPATKGELTADQLRSLTPADLRALEQGRSVNVPAKLRDREAIEIPAPDQR